MLFKDVKLSKPDDGQFNPPSRLKKYDRMMAMRREDGRRPGYPPGPAGQVKPNPVLGPAICRPFLLRITVADGQNIFQIYFKFFPIPPMP